MGAAHWAHEETSALQLETYSRQAKKPNRKPVYYCAVGYIGVDCSLDASLPPVIIGLRTGPVCDVRGPNPCTFISIFLTQFTFIHTFTCRFVCIPHLYFVACKCLMNTGRGREYTENWMGSIPVVITMLARRLRHGWLLCNMSVPSDLIVLHWG